MFPIRKRHTLLVLTTFVYLLFGCKSSKVISPDVNTSDTVEASIPKAPPETLASFLTEYLQENYKERVFEKYIYVSVNRQRLYLIINDSIIKRYPVSTAKKGIGSKSGSNKTPTGLHSIKRKIGKDVPYGGIIRARVYTGKIAKIFTEKKRANRDYITSRIMWLQGEDFGLNKGRNVDSYKRYIYIHGTPEEGFVGEAASHGCIRMTNADVIALFEWVDEGIPVLIMQD